jgi:hypothetical protein
MRHNAELYDYDFYTWTQETAALIAAGKWHEIDQARLAEEVAGLGRDEQREVARRVQHLLTELLLWWALPGERKGNWAAAIIEARARLEDMLADSPGLSAHLGTVLAAEYPEHGESAVQMAGTSPGHLPVHRDVLDLAFLPGATLATTVRAREQRAGTLRACRTGSAA